MIPAKEAKDLLYRMITEHFVTFTVSYLYIDILYVCLRRKGVDIQLKAIR